MIIYIREKPESQAAYPLYGGISPPDERKEGVANGYIF